MRTMPTSIFARRAAGFSIVELMISVVIGLLAILFATRLIITSETNKASSLGGSDQMQNGMLALFSINEDAAQAGWGLNDPLLAGCNTVFSDDDGYALPQITRGGLPATPLAAALIVPGGAGSDELSLFSGSDASGVASVKITQVYDGGNTLRVSSNAPFGYVEDSVIVVAPGPAGGNCALAQLSVAPNGTVLTFDGVGGKRFNNGTLGAAGQFGDGQSRVFNLGPARTLSFHTWSVRNGVLMVRATNMAGAAAAPVSVVDNIVALKAQYGFDTRLGNAFTPRGGMQIGVWSNTMINADGVGADGDAGDFQRIAALRIGVVARSKVPERPDPATGQCSATREKPRLFTAAAPSTVAAQPVEVDVAVPGDTVGWQCYRYRVFDTVVPLRNASWSPT